jgi:hypothetical protein
LATGSVLAGSLLLHPALGIAAAGYILIACATPLKEVAHRHGEAVMEWIIFAVVVIGISVELLRIVHHLDLFRAHMTYQVHRKTGSPLHSKLIKPQGLILMIGCLALATLLWRRHFQPELGTVWDVLLMAAVTLGILIYAVVAGEITCNVYSLSVGPALVFCLICRDFLESSGRPPHLISEGQSPLDLHL